MSEDKSVRILVVDDDPEVALGYRRLLEKAGYECATACSGAETLASLTTARPDLILLDRDLPDGDGMEICRRIKTDTALSDISVVIVSGAYVAAEEKAGGLESGADGYITRPIINRELLARIQAFVRMLQMSRSLRWQTRALETANEELVRAQREIEASRQRYAKLYDFAPVGYLTLDEEGTILEANLTAASLLGADRRDLISRSFHRFISHDSQDAFSQHKQEVLSAKSRQRCELLLCRPDDTKFDAGLETVAVAGEGGERRFFMVLSDITERCGTEIRRKLQFVTISRLAEADSLAEAAPAILQATCESLGWTMGELWETPPGAETMRLVALWSPPSLSFSAFATATRNASFTKESGLPGTVWASGRPVWKPDLAGDPGFVRAEAAAKNNLHSAFAYPILMGREVKGVMAFYSQEIRQNPQDLIQIFATVGGQISQFIERKRAENALATEQRKNLEASECRTRQQTAISDLAQYALGETTLDSLLGKAEKLVGEALGVELCKVLQLEPDGASLAMRAGIGWKEGGVGRVKVPCGRESQAGFALLVEEPVIVEDLRSETRFHDSRLLLDHGVVSGMCVIIHGRARPYGVLGAHTKRRRKFTGDDLHFLQSIANVLAASIERRELEEELVAISNREQQRIGQDLHDGLCQVLAGLRMQTELVARELPAENEAKGKLDKVTASLAEAVKTARMLARGLFPVAISSHGLMSALEELTHSVTASSSVDCRLRREQPVLIDDNTVATHLYRIAQEAVHNAVRHGQAKHIEVTLSSTDKGKTLTIVDDGSGLPPDAGESSGMGLRIMSYRAEMIGGKLEISPHEPHGTRVLCQF